MINPCCCFFLQHLEAPKALVQEIKDQRFSQRAVFSPSHVFLGVPAAHAIQHVLQALANEVPKQLKV